MFKMLKELILISIILINCNKIHLQWIWEPQKDKLLMLISTKLNNHRLQILYSETMKEKHPLLTSKLPVEDLLSWDITEFKNPPFLLLLLVKNKFKFLFMELTAVYKMLEDLMYFSIKCLMQMLMLMSINLKPQIQTTICNSLTLEICKLNSLNQMPEINKILTE